ncbi:U32 family peptidase C-terminal domain-containing protein, partial [Staphylococcus aureus]|nr:U32 family peptidase C-terminal domain-containing protein [Staphylococcus aureus]
CTLSNHMTARDSNRGGCCQSCRWDYELLEVDDNGELDVFYNEDTKIATIQQRNNFKPGQEIEFFGPEIETFTQVVEAIYDEEGNSLDAARHPLQIVQIKVDRPIYPNNMMRKEIG